MSRIKFLLLLSALAAQAPLASAAILRYVVGTCQPSLTSFSTISAALAATPAPFEILVCPGTYNEQVVITQAVTLEGVSSGNSAQAIIAPPAGGLLANATDYLGNPVAAQVWVNNAAGPVNLRNLTVDGTGNAVTSFPPYIVGVFYQNSAGTVNGLTTRKQNGNGKGLGVWLEGGNSNPSVSVENSTIHDFDGAGILTDQGFSALTATVKGNEVNAPVNSAVTGIHIQAGTTDTVTGNFVAGGAAGIYADVGSMAGSISGNTVVNSGWAITVLAYDVPVTSNRIFNSTAAGILVVATASLVQGNSIYGPSISPGSGPSVGLNFACAASNNVRSNIIADVDFGIAQASTAVVTTNTYINVGTIRNGGC